MEGIYRFQRHIYDMTRRYYLLGRDELLDRLAVPIDGSVLEIGCGTGRNLMGVARRYPTARIYGLDISEEMLKSATNSLERSGNRSRTVLACADATTFQAEKCFGQSKFDRMFFSYTLSMIPDWQLALERALDCLGANGALHIVDFGQSAKLPKFFRSTLFAWLKLFHVHPRQDLVAKLKAIAAAKGLSLTFESRFRDYAWLMVLRRVA